MPVRVALLILAVAGLIGTAYFLWISEAKLRVTAGAFRDFDTSVSSAARGVLELRAAQHSYVAAGQGEQFWIAKVAAALPDLKASIGAMRAHAGAPQAQAAVDALLATFQDFERIDARASEYARNGQRLIASDLIFSDGLEMTAAALRALDEARDAERAAYERVVRETRRAEISALGGFAGLAVLVMGLLLPVGRQRKAELQAPVGGPAAETAVVTPDPLDLALKIDGPARTWDAPREAAQPPPPLPATPPNPVDLDSIALVCTELSRMADTRSLPSILERSAGPLNASGIVLWIADPDGRELAAIAAHGYSPQLLNRLGTIARDAENATAAAFRTGLVQTVSADAASPGAIVVPLMTPRGAVGVMAAEVKGDGEKQPERLAAAAIIAAQLATLVGPPSARTQATAGAATA